MEWLSASRFSGRWTGFVPLGGRRFFREGSASVLMGL
jgi:hypothetical protein